MVHCGVGCLQQALHGFGLVLRDGDTDTRCHDQVMSFYFYRLGEHVQQALRNHAR